MELVDANTKNYVFLTLSQFNAKQKLVRTRVSEVSISSRNTQGVMLIRLAPEEKLVGLERVQEPSEEEIEMAVEAAEEGEAQQPEGDEQQPVDDQE